MAEGEEKIGIIDSMPLFAKELIAGGVTGGIAKTAVAPLERIKILFQVPNHYGFFLQLELGIVSSTELRLICPLSHGLGFKHRN